MSKLLWYWHRLAAMERGEVLARLREKSLKLSESWQRSSLEGFRLADEPVKILPLPPASEASDEQKLILRGDAERLMKGQWSLYGWKEITIDTPPLWQKDPIKGVDLQGIDGLNHRNLPEGADVRNIWEINRWSEMVRLGMHAYVNDDRYGFEVGLDWLEDWVKHNPVGTGLNWASSLEAGLRLINFCWFDSLIETSLSVAKDYADLSERLQRVRDQILPAHVWWVKRYLSFGSSANNHRLGELTGLLLTVKRWPELTALAGDSAELSAHIEESLLQQFSADGGNREQALHYHLFAFELGWQACLVSPDSVKVKQRLEKAAEYFVHLSHDKESWDFGDSDDAQVVPCTASRITATHEWKDWMQGRPGALRYWLGAGPKVTQSTPGWWIASESGMACFNSDGWKIRLDASALGFGNMAAHGHTDALHVSIWDGDCALVIDPGTGGYYATPELRGRLADWPAHNSPQPAGGFKFPERKGCFLWSGTHEVPSLKWDDGNLSACLAHEGFNISRKVRADGTRGLEIEDEVAQADCFGSRWFFAPECWLEVVDQKVIVTRDDKQWQVSFSSERLALSLTKDEASRHYGSVERCFVLETKGKNNIKSHWMRLK